MRLDAVVLVNALADELAHHTLMAAVGWAQARAEAGMEFDASLLVGAVSAWSGHPVDAHEAKFVCEEFTTMTESAHAVWEACWRRVGASDAAH